MKCDLLFKINYCFFNNNHVHFILRFKCVLAESLCSCVHSFFFFFAHLNFLDIPTDTGMLIFK